MTDRCFLEDSCVRRQPPDGPTSQTREQEARTKSLDAPPGLYTLVAAEIVHDDDIAGLERRNEHPLHIGVEDDAVHGCVDHERCGDTVMAQAGDESGCLPVPVGHPAESIFNLIAVISGRYEVIQTFIGRKLIDGVSDGFFEVFGGPGGGFSEQGLEL